MLYLFIYLSVCLFVCLFSYLFACFVCLLACLFICLFACLMVCLCVKAHIRFGSSKLYEDSQLFLPQAKKAAVYRINCCEMV